jgi:hypothetical protein
MVWMSPEMTPAPLVLTYGLKATISRDSEESENQGNEPKRKWRKRLTPVYR